MRTRTRAYTLGLLMALLPLASPRARAQGSTTGEKQTSASSSAAGAQASQTAKKRLKIGLVLSGGGARGLAHIGVLEWFEKNRIPVDYISGTSMGGLIGGMYAMGMSPGELRAFLKNVDWEQAIASGPAYDQMSFRRREDRRNFQAQLEIGLRNGLRLSTGLSSAHYIGLTIDRLALPYSTISSFDELPIPFRCMATDFLKAEPVPLRDGPLASAMLATMSIPGVFPPVERDGKVLVDGGLLNNIPTNVMREMKPDVVIAVDIGTRLGEMQTILTFTGVLQQSITVMTMENDRRNLRLADIIIAPELGEHSMLDFSDVDRVAALGYQSAEAKAAILQNFSLDEAAWQQYLAQRNAKKRTAIPTPDGLRIAGVKEELQTPIRRRIDHHAGRKLDTEELETDLTHIIGQGRYASLGYSFEHPQEQPEKNILLIRVREKNHAPPTLNFSVELDSSDVAELNFTVGTRVTLYDAGGYGSEWRNDVKLGFRSVFETEYFRPLGAAGVFAAARGSYRRGKEDIFPAAAAQFAIAVNRVDAGFDIGFLSRRNELRLGHEFGFQGAESSVASALPSLDGLVNFSRIRWTFDGQDSSTIPRRGLLVSAQWRWYHHAPQVSAFPQAELRSSLFVPVSERGSMFVRASVGTSFHRNAGLLQQFTLGGPFRLGAYDRDELRGNHYFLGSLGYRHALGQLPPLLGGRIYAIGWYDAGSAYQNAGFPLVRHEGSGGFVVDTKLGPFSLIGSMGQGLPGQSVRGKVYFAFGKFF